MPRTPDSFPGPRLDEAILLDSGAAPTANGEITYVSGVGFRFFEEGVEKGLGGTSLGDHAALRQLIHFIEEGPAEGFASGAMKVIVGQPFPTSVTWWASADLDKKLVSKAITRNSSQMPTQIQWKVYAVDGTTVLATVTDSITYDSGVFEVSRTRTIS